MNENLSFQDNDEICEEELDEYVTSVILEAQASLAQVLITVCSTSTVEEEVITFMFTDREKFPA